ncbi:alpha/beta hydrolase family protein [Winogradskyella sp. A3E31]|uniref:alpha/beta hydrolase family protein n=1 Tax=Winogradskyella sp. A3E31 TaxID=3349637 RepID=UPI00398A7119
MKTTKLLLFNIIFIALLTFSCESKKEKATETEKSDTESSTEIQLITSDSLDIYGDLYQLDKSAPTILLFHQGGSNARAEYEPIIPILTAKGYNILAIDQRVGGQIYGSYNRSVAKIKHRDYGYCDAYPDLEAALDYVIENGFNGPRIAWGSSYSGSLVIQLGHNRPDDIDAILAFSPASSQQLEECLPSPYFETLKPSLLILRPGREAEIESVQEQLKLAESFNHQTYVAPNGVHGSSMLVKERTKSSTDDTFNTVLDFLEKYNN